MPMVSPRPPRYHDEKPWIQALLMTTDFPPIRVCYSYACEEGALCHQDYGDFRRGPPQP